MQRGPTHRRKRVLGLFTGYDKLAFAEAYKNRGSEVFEGFSDSDERLRSARSPRQQPTSPSTRSDFSGHDTEDLLLPRKQGSVDPEATVGDPHPQVRREEPGDPASLEEVPPGGLAQFGDM